MKKITGQNLVYNKYTCFTFVIDHPETSLLCVTMPIFHREIRAAIFTFKIEEIIAKMIYI